MRSLLIIILALLLAAGGWVLHTLWLSGQFKQIEPHFAGACRQHPITGGAEDIAIDRPTQRAFISVTDRWAFRADQPPAGRILTLDLADPQAEPVNATPDAPADFAPHGIALYRSGAQLRLFVINHPGTASAHRHSVEIYDWIDGRLVHQRRLEHPAFLAPNDLVATGPDSFYFTNDHGEPSGWLRSVEETLRLPWSNVYHYAAGEARQVAGDIAYANGIALSEDGRDLYVAAPNDFGVHHFRRDPASQALSPAGFIPLGTAPDNLSIDADGQLWTGAHPKLLAFLAHGKDPAQPAPSQVLRIDPAGSATEILLDDGSLLSGSSVAVRLGQRLLVGGVYDKRVLDCRFQQ